MSPKIWDFTKCVCKDNAVDGRAAWLPSQCASGTRRQGRLNSIPSLDVSGPGAAFAAPWPSAPTMNKHLFSRRCRSST